MKTPCFLKLNIKRKNGIITKSHIAVWEIQVPQIYAFITAGFTGWKKTNMLTEPFVHSIPSLRREDVHHSVVYGDLLNTH